MKNLLLIAQKLYQDGNIIKFRSYDTHTKKTGCSYGIKLNSEDIINKYFIDLEKMTD